MGIILRRDKGSRLSIEELDNNFEFLAMDSEDIDLYWKTDETDIVSDTMYFTGSLALRTFDSIVYRLGISIRDYSLIENHSPEFVIERYKKTDKKVRNGDIFRSAAKFRITEPYSDYVKASEMNQIDSNKNTIFRPMIFPITAASAYYRIYAENYYSQVKPPRVSGSKRGNFYKFSTGSIGINDDSDNYSINLPKKQVGIVYCRLRIRISDGLGGYKYSKPLKEFKIRMKVYFDNGSLKSIVKYDMV